MNECFPKMIDTKVLALDSQHKVKIKSHLEGLYEDLFIKDSTLKPYNNVVLNESLFFCINKNN